MKVGFPQPANKVIRRDKMLPHCALTSIRQTPKVEADFCGGDITSNGGIPLLSQVDQQLGLSRAAAGALTDPRRQASCDHSSLALLQQRIYALALEYEDLNDHQQLRHDLALQTAASRVETLASPSTLCRFEQRFDRRAAVGLIRVRRPDLPPTRRCFR